jgi:hypothetical protein
VNHIIVLPRLILLAFVHYVTSNVTYHFPRSTEESLEMLCPPVPSLFKLPHLHFSPYASSSAQWWSEPGIMHKRAGRIISKYENWVYFICLDFCPEVDSYFSIFILVFDDLTMFVIFFSFLLRQKKNYIKLYLSTSSYYKHFEIQYDLTIVTILHVIDDHDSGQWGACHSWILKSTGLVFQKFSHP